MLFPATIVLADGSGVLVRPIRPEDRARLREGLARLSPASRYSRFLAVREGFTEGELDYLVYVDHHDHEALLAFDAATGEGVGIARYVRTGARTAEPAVTVVDDWQGRGLGNRLAHLLALRARQAGVRSFVALTLATNQAAIHMLERLGRTRQSPAGAQVLLRTRLRSSGALLRGSGATTMGWGSGRRRWRDRPRFRRGGCASVAGLYSLGRLRPPGRRCRPRDEGVQFLKARPDPVAQDVDVRH